MRQCRVSLVLMSLLVFSTAFIFSGCGSDTSRVVRDNLGVVVLSNGWIGIIDGETQTVTAPLLTGELGSSGGGVFDVVISPDGKTTLVSNFGDGMITFIDTSDPAIPVVIGTVTLSFFAEDIAMTADGRYALVTDGGFTSKIAVLDVKNHSLVEEFIGAATPSPSPTLYHCAVAVGADGTVLTVDYFGGFLHALKLSDDGHLTYVAATDVTNGGTIRPVNLAISPDGQTVIVACISNSAANTLFPVLTITSPGVVELSDMVTPGISLTAAQSIVFNSTGTKAYLNCVQPAPDPLPTPGYIEHNVINVLNITATGKAVDAGTPMDVDFVGTSQLFGVDTMAMDNQKGYLYVSNMTLSGAKNHLQVLDVNTGTLVKTITFDPVTVGADDLDSLPTGITFLNP